MTHKKVVVILAALILCLSSAAFAQITYTVTNLNASGTGSFAAAVASSESDGQDSRIEFSVGGTIHPAARYSLAAGNCEICITTAPSPGITFDCDNARSAFNVTSNGNRFCNIKIINTAVNTDGITIQGANNVVERCSFDLCRDEATGITGAGARNNIVAFSRIENCGSQPGDGTNWANGRGILITVGASVIMVGDYVYHCNRGITTNSANSFSDTRNCKIDSSLSPASGNGTTIDGPSQGNVMNCVSSNNALNGFRFKLACTFYRTGLTGSGNALSLVSIDTDCTESGSVLTRADTPFPAWLSGATTPTNASDVGMGTGDCQCYAGGVTKATNPNPANGSTSVSTTADLGWTAGTGATSHDVYFGTNSASLTFRGNQGGTTYDTGTMANSTTYYWRIDELPGPVTGDLWNFTTAAATQTKATNPTPANSATGVAVTTDLSWTAGTGATSHDVYFGTNSASLTFKGNQAGTTYDTGTMANGVTYYWRIDEVGGTTITGDLWRFTTVASGTNGTYYSDDALDGWLKESTETSGVGGSFNTTATYLGDTNTKQQYIGVLSFDTSAIPDTATITSATLTITRLGITGDPTTLGTITVDIKNGYYGTSSSLAAADFEAASSATGVATIPYPSSNGAAVSGTLSSAGRAQINKTGLTQFKIRFATDDDNDSTADYLNVYDTSNTPKLDVTWQ